MTRKSLNSTLFVIFLILGIVITIQFRTVIKDNEKSRSTSLYIEDITSQLNEQKELAKRLSDRIKNYEQQWNTYVEFIVKDNNSEELKELKTQLDNTRMIAGLTKVKGKGITITLNDAPKTIEQYNTNNILVHD